VSLSVDSLSIYYSGREVINAASFSLAEGEIAALIGPNGTGKTTLLKGLAGLVPAHGRIDFDSALDAAGAAQDCDFAYMPQDTASRSSLTVLEVIVLGRLSTLGVSVPRQTVQQALRVLRQFGLANLQARRLGELSGGQRQMVYLAQTLFRQSRVLLLDEPTGALDLMHQLAVLDAVKTHTRRANAITVMALHDLTLASRFADRIICLDNGRLVADGTPENVLTHELIRQVYHVDAEILFTRDGHRSVVPLCGVVAEARPQVV
jgi:iron complex transport system ATP-binding protein